MSRAHDESFHSLQMMEEGNAPMAAVAAADLVKYQRLTALVALFDWLMQDGHATVLANISIEMLT